METHCCQELAWGYRWDPAGERFTPLSANDTRAAVEAKGIQQSVVVDPERAVAQPVRVLAAD